MAKTQKQKNEEYWEKRFTALNAASQKRSQAYYATVQTEYDKASARMADDAAVWFARFAGNNGVSVADARKLLNSNELKEFQWDVQDYIKYGRENALDQRWMKELENASARYHISRLESLQLQLKSHVEGIFGKESSGIDTLLKTTYENDYYHTAFEVQRGTHVGYTFAKLPDKQLDVILSKPWAADGSTFSDDLWNNKEALENNLQTHLFQSILRGDDPKAAIKALAADMGTGKYRAGRLIMTESAYFASLAQGDAFREMGVEKYEIVATLDSHTSSLCQAMDGKLFDMKDFKAGISAPPFHPWCRTVTAPWFPDDYGDSVRAARDEKGATYFVPADMKYPAWKELYVDGGLTKLGSGDIIYTYSNDGKNEKLHDPGILVTTGIQLLQAFDDFKLHTDNMDEPYKSVYKYYSDNTVLQRDPNQFDSIGYSTKKDNIKYNDNLFKIKQEQQPGNLIFSHELAHRYDYLVVKSWRNNEFVNAITKASDTITSDIEKYRELYESSNDVNPAYQDILSALTVNKIYTQYGHRDSYWSKNNVAIEIFADLAYLRANNISIPEFDGVLDEMLLTFDKIFEGGI